MPPSGAAIPRRSRRKKLLGRAKSCRWQVFVRRRPPKQGELRTDVSKATMFQGDRGLRPSGLPGTIQSSAGEDFSSFFRWHEPNPAFRTKRRRKGFESVQRSGVTAKGFRADCKRRALFFTNSRLWLGAKGRRLWWKRASLGGDKKGLVQMDGFWFAKKGYILSPCKANR